MKTDEEFIGVAPTMALSEMDYLPKGNEDASECLCCFASASESEMDYLPKGNEDLMQVRTLSQQSVQSEMDYLPKGNEDVVLYV